MSISLTNQIMALIKLNNEQQKLENKLYDLPRVYDEFNARIHLNSMGIKIDSLSDTQYEYLGVVKGEQLKTDDYHY
ncbi:adenosylhomocysteinase [Bacillus toyonensis]|nr:adenosylhomocysteinase [Bacillus toyonensis]